MRINGRFQLAAAFAFVALSAMSSQSVFALGLPIADAEDMAAPKLAPFAEELESSNVDFTAIVALSNCSGSLVRFTSSQPSDKALVMTNGHCLDGGFLDDGEVITNANSSRSFNLLSSDGRRSLATLRASKIEYATMTDTDVSFYRLTQTYAEITANTGVEALTISPDHATVGEPITIASGYWRRLYSCKIENFIFNLKEGDWTWLDSILYSEPGCDTIGGTSGSPIIQSDTKEIVGINNTGNEDGQRCTLNNPCEVGEDGQVNVRDGSSYGQQVYKVYTCLTVDNQIDVNLDSCELPKPQTLH